MKRSLWPVCHVVAALYLLSAAASGQARQALVHHADNRPLPSLERAAEIARLQAPAFQDVFYVVPNQVREDIRSVTDDAAGKSASEAAVQLESGPNAPATVWTSFEGSTNADNGRVVGFRVAPPDTDGDVGPNHYVQMINMITTVFDKSGNPLGGGAFPSNAIWSGAGGLCQSTNRGDPIVVYDEPNDRWLVSQFAFNSSSSPPFSQ